VYYKKNVQGSVLAALKKIY